MASDSAWNLGADIAMRSIAEHHARKDMLADEDRRLKVNDLIAQRDSITKKLPYLTEPERKGAEEALNDIHLNVRQIYHPIHNPGALQKDWHWLKGMFDKKPAKKEPGTPEDVLEMPSQDITVPGKTIQVNGQPVSIPPALIPTGTQTVRMLFSPAYEKAALKPAAMTPQQRQEVAQRDEARADTARDMAGQDLTPEQEGRAQTASQMAGVREAMRGYGEANPDATPQQKTEFFNGLINKTFGMTEKPQLKEYVSADGKSRAWLDANRPETIPPGWNATVKESADTRTRADFAADVEKGYNGSFEQWKVEQSQRAKLAVPTNRDDRYIAIEQRKLMGQPLSKDDQAYASAYDLYIKERVISPINARAAASANDRYVQVMDLNDPEKIVFMRAGDAARSGAGTPASISFQIDKAITRYMVAGPGATNISYFNTAVDHLKLLSETATALKNNDLQLLNAWGNAFATATGDPAPTNFETVRSAVAGELSKTFKGTGATDAEIAQIQQEINQAESPRQLTGAISHYLRLMGGKLNAMKAQYAEGKKGLPAFAPESKAGAPAAPPAPAAPAAPGGGAEGDQFIYATNGQGKLKRAKKGMPLPPGWKLVDAPTQ